MNRVRGKKGESIEMPSDLKDWEPAALNDTADACGQQFQNIDTSQIRNIFSEVKRIQLEWKKNRELAEVKRGLILLQPKLAYAAGRKKQVIPFKDKIGEAIDAVINSDEPEDAVENFFSFMEAVVAYHKYYSKGGR